MILIFLIKKDLLAQLAHMDVPEPALVKGKAENDKVAAADIDEGEKPRILLIKASAYKVKKRQNKTTYSCVFVVYAV